MSTTSGISVADECIHAFNELRYGKSAKPKFIIFKISDDNKRVIVDESSTEVGFEAFRQRLAAAVDKEGNPVPRYAIYDMEYDLGSEGRRTKTVFVHWGPCEAPIKLCMLYASSAMCFKSTLNSIQASIHADSLEELTWEVVLKEVSGGQA
ncbi:uncharacterized protein N7515_005462 [Penicillium bovifimosum]|uniref:Cofilin n=1 Tax=Penicillium bovifimosum TaxID=126998 RepID=A0A9W9KYT4_9EURO|nr:uncharacterized protein N7515_005462 [Penicillium bovifimosum]KAJ5129423.1 hypothetical protein N7515_005462 [Penicillium bovifimosum]